MVRRFGQGPARERKKEKGGEEMLATMQAKLRLLAGPALQDLTTFPEIGAKSWRIIVRRRGESQSASFNIDVASTSR